MCKVYNSVGCLTYVKNHLTHNNISDFNSLNEVIAFRNNYETSRQLIISTSEVAIEKEKNQIISDNLQLKESIESTKKAVERVLLEQIDDLKKKIHSLSSLDSQSVWHKIARYFKIFFLNRKIRNYESACQSNIIRSIQELNDKYEKNNRRFEYIKNRFKEAVFENCTRELGPLDRKKFLIDQVESYIYGAIGEQKVVRELEKLPDDYVLINDFSLSFNPPIYNRNENDYIKSIQIDHLLISPSGIFIIETKNWSKESLNNLALRSPVSQIKRASYAFFTIINSERSDLSLAHHHWGKKKIVVKNIIVLVNQKPLGEFQYVKVLTLDQLQSYIRYFPPIYSQRETEAIANELVRLS